MKWQSLDQEPCSLARALSVVGDRWTLLILRDCFLGVRRFDAFQSRLGIARRVLSERLAAMVEEGVLDRVPYQERPVRHEYRLTPRGMAFYPVILALVHWGDRHCEWPEGPPVRHRHRSCGHEFSPVLSCSECGYPVAARDVIVRQAGWVDESTATG